MLIKIIIVFTLFFVLYSLASGLYYLLQDKGQSTRVVKALTWRVGISLGLFIFLFIASYAGWIHPQVV